MYYIGVDLGGTNIAAGIVSEEGKILFKDSVPTHARREAKEILIDLANLCLKIIENNNIDKKDIHSIGIGSPGICDFENGIVIYASNINFENTDINIVSELTGIDVYLDNDANCAAYGEAISGANKGTKHSITITLGTGVGSGIIANGEILRGTNAAGECGHHVIEHKGALCNCGKRGCWEAYSSATGLIRDAKEAAENNKDSLLYTDIDGELNKIDAKYVFDIAQKNDKVAMAVIENYIDYLSVGISNVIDIFQPEIIAIGGGIGEQKDKLLTPLIKKVKEYVFGGTLKTRIVSSVLGNDAGIIGAAFLKK